MYYQAERESVDSKEQLDGRLADDAGQRELAEFLRHNPSRGRALRDTASWSDLHAELTSLQEELLREVGPRRVRRTPEKLPVYMWIVNETEAIFSIEAKPERTPGSLKAQKAITFSTRDGRIVMALSTVFQTYWAGADTLEWLGSVREDVD